MWSTHRDSNSSSGGSSGDPAKRNGGGSAAVDSKNEAEKSKVASKIVSYRSILKSRAEEEALSYLSPSQSSLKAKTTTRSGGWRKNGGESEFLPTLGVFPSKMDRRRDPKVGWINHALLTEIYRGTDTILTCFAAFGESGVRGNPPIFTCAVFDFKIFHLCVLLVLKLSDTFDSAMVALHPSWCACL